MTRTNATCRLLIAFVMTFASLLALPVAAADAAPDATKAGLIKRGEYLAIAADCGACHTAAGGKPMAGGLSLPSPLGAIVSSNITPSKMHGIGNYTLAQFSDALRKGVAADGDRLYPAMPYTAYAKLTDDDVAALYAYFMNAVVPVDIAVPETSLPFPFNIRQSMLAWNLLFLDSKPFVPDGSKSAEWNRGAYLAEALAHCSTCHTPRNVLMAEENSKRLSGASTGGWYAPNITSDANSGIGSWSQQEIIDYLRLGHAAGKAQAAGPMAEAIDKSFSQLSSVDLQALATWLKAVPAQHDAADMRPADAWGEPSADLDSIRGVPLPNDAEQMTGPQLYDAHCATCHQAYGQGSFDGGLPALFHNTALGHTNSDNLVMVMLNGIQRSAQPQNGTQDIFMPAFAKVLSDRQIATLGAYLTQRYGNPKATVTAEQVRTLRVGETSSLIVWARAGMAAVVVLLILAIMLVLRKRRRSAF